MGENYDERREHSNRIYPRGIFFQVVNSLRAEIFVERQTNWMQRSL